MQLVKDFFAAIDAKWVPRMPGKARLSIIGCGALMLQTNYERGTKDSDVLQTTELSNEVADRLVRVGGSGTALHVQHKMYVDIVGNGIPFMPHVPLWRVVDVDLVHLELVALDVVDVVVAKLKPFRATDVSDIDAMIERGLVDHAHLLRRFRSAFDLFVGDARVSELRNYVKNLNRVERDMLGVAETEFELPSWV